MVPDEAPILSAIDQGDARLALKLMMASYGDRVFDHCARFLGNDALAADVHQLVFVQAYEGLGRFERRSSVRSWLFGIAHHRCLDALKSARRARRREAGDGDVSEVPDLHVVEPGRAIDADKINRALEDCLAELAPKIHTAVLLRLREELTFEEMGSMLGESAGTLQARVSRAMPQVRDCLTRKGITP